MHQNYDIQTTTNKWRIIKTISDGRKLGKLESALVCDTDGYNYKDYKAQNN